MELTIPYYCTLAELTSSPKKKFFFILMGEYISNVFENYRGPQTQRAACCIPLVFSKLTNTHRHLKCPWCWHCKNIFGHLEDRMSPKNENFLHSLLHPVINRWVLLLKLRLLSRQTSGMPYFVIERVEWMVTLLSLSGKYAVRMPVRIKALIFLITNMYSLIRRQYLELGTRRLFPHPAEFISHWDSTVFSSY